MHLPVDTVRLTFRELTPADIDFVFSVRSDAEIMRFYPQTYSREECLAWIEKHMGFYMQDGHGFWLLLSKSFHKPIGLAGLTLPEVDGVKEPEVGYMIHKSYWRQGYASEAACAIRDFALDALEKPRVISLIRPENIPSIGVAKKMGMTIEKETMHAGLNHLVFSIRKQERG